VPLYTYYCPACDTGFELITSIDSRDNQMCESCGYKLVRGLDRPGMVWSPTRNGGYSL
jgi:putative FmdB family regulatory protein